MCKVKVSKKRISLWELRENYEERKPSRIVYNTDNNRTRAKSGAFKECMEIVKPKCELIFNELDVWFQPNVVGLKGPGGVIAFRGVEEIWLENYYDIWDAVYLKCSGSDIIFGLLFDY